MCYSSKNTKPFIFEFQNETKSGDRNNETKQKQKTYGAYRSSFVIKYKVTF